MVSLTSFESFGNFLDCLGSSELLGSFWIVRDLLDRKDLPDRLGSKLLGSLGVFSNPLRSFCILWDCLMFLDRSGSFGSFRSIGYCGILWILWDLLNRSFGIF